MDAISPMRLYHITFVLPSDAPASASASVDAYLHALRPPPQSSGGGSEAPLGGKLIQLSQDPAWLVKQVTAIAPSVRLLVVPRDPQEPVVAHPPALLSAVEVDRANWELTCVRFARSAAAWQPPSLWQRLTGQGGK